MEYHRNILIASILCLSIFTGCKKIIEVDSPQNQLTTDKVFSDTTTINAALVSAYAQLDKTLNVNYNKFLGLYTDELSYPAATSNEFYISNLSIGNTNVTNVWKSNYFIIYSCNDIISQLQNANSIPSANKLVISGEAQFLRAYAYFYLTNTFESVPLILTTDVNQTAQATQSDSLTVYNQIVTDLKDAQAKLPVTYIGSGRVRANKWVATALLARLYLYKKDWANAEATASTVINSGLFSLTPSVNNIFLANSSETILQCWTQNGFIADATSLIPSTGAPTYPVTASFINAFESGDMRKTNWLKSTVVNGTTYYYPYKYHNRATNTSLQEYLMLLRLSEQYLIRAEAKAQQGNTSGAISDINLIRGRAGLFSPIPSTLNKSATLDAVMQEWRIEFFNEWGHRYLDLKRTGRLNPLMSAYKSTWSQKAILFPIPLNETTLNPFLVQNPGY